VNKRFEQVSGWKWKDAIGKDHNIVSSGVHHPGFWKSMYRTVVKNRGVWNDIVTNQTKDGRPYHVDTYIKGIFDQETDEFKGFMSIRHDVTDVFNALNEIDKKNTYLEHAAKILRHDMHSGIHIYIPRGISSLERRLTPELIKQYKLESPLKMLKEGLEHTQRIYKGVFEFTNLVKMNSILEKKPCKLDKVLDNYLQSTSYRGQVILSEYLPVIDINESLFCTAIDNLIRNGLKYNDSETKVVAIFLEDNDTIAIQDNGRGMSQEDFDKLSKPYARKEGQKESGTGLGLNICIAILNEHGFEVNCEKLPEGGTKIKIKFR
jgi:PAS domain S-box-containing protein